MQLTIPDLSLVVLIGPSGAGKSTFARRHFRPTEVLSSDFFRGLVCDDEADQSASGAAFELLHLALAKRLAFRRFTVVDATNVQEGPRQTLLDLARRFHFLTTAVVLDLPEAVCQGRNSQRPGRTVAPPVVRLHRQQLEQTLARLRKERFSQVFVLSSPEEIDAVTVARQPMPFDHRHAHGPFDLIGDVHGCFDELTALLTRLGYDLTVRTGGELGYLVRPPAGRKAVFVGDFVDRGPRVPEVLRLVMDMTAAGSALCVIGNHDDKLLRQMRGNRVNISHGLAVTLEQLQGEHPEFRERVRDFLGRLPSHLLLDGGKLVVAHAGLTEPLQGRESKRVRAFCLYGQTTGEMDDDSLPVRGNWGADYSGRAAVVYGHTPVAEPVWVNRTLNIDTGCVFGGRLTALRYPELELLSVPAPRVYCVPPRPLLSPPEGPSETVVALGEGGVPLVMLDGRPSEEGRKSETPVPTPPGPGSE
jgi:protein phosphatase